MGALAGVRVSVKRERTVCAERVRLLFKLIDAMRKAGRKLIEGRRV